MIITRGLGSRFLITRGYGIIPASEVKIERERIGLMNWFDTFADKWGDYTNFLHSRHLNAVAPRIKVYLLDRSNGPSDTVYNEEINRIYLPYFTIRGIYVVQQWTQQLGLNAIEEPDQDAVNVILHFEHMVDSMRNLKELHKYDINVTYSGITQCSFKKANGILYIKENYVVTHTVDLSLYSIKELSELIATFSNFTSEYLYYNNRGTETALNIVDFEETSISTGEVINIYSLDQMYQRIEEYIKNGDLIVTHQNVLYEVVSAYVTNLRFFTWPSFLLKCQKRQLSDYAKLPRNGLNTIYQDGMLLAKFRNENNESH